MQGGAEWSCRTTCLRPDPLGPRHAGLAGGLHEPRDYRMPERRIVNDAEAEPVTDRAEHVIVQARTGRRGASRRHWDCLRPSRPGHELTGSPVGDVDALGSGGHLCRPSATWRSPVHLLRGRGPRSRQRAALAYTYVANVVQPLFQVDRRLYALRNMWHAMKQAGYEMARDQVGQLMRIWGIASTAHGNLRTISTTVDLVAARHPDVIDHT